MALQIRRGSTADRLAYTPEVGELIFDTTTKTLYVGDGSQVGGIASTSLTRDDVQDYAAELLTNGVHTGISFTYNDSLGTINAVVTGGGGASTFELRVAADNSTTRLINSGETIQFSGANGISTTSTTEGEIIISAPSYHSNLEVDNLDARIIAHPASSTIEVTSPIRFQTRVNADDDLIVGNVLYVGSQIGTDDAAIEFVKTKYEPGLHFVTFRQYCNDSFGGTVNLVKSRGDFNSELPVQSGDDVGSYAFSAYDGTNFIGVGAINVEVTGAVSTNSIPCAMRFIMHNGVSRATRAEITSTSATNTTFKVNNLGAYTRGFIGFNDVPRLPSFATDGAANTAIGAGLGNGMLYYNTTTHKFMGYANGAWVALN
jgi:hypothetical protein